MNNHKHHKDGPALAAILAAGIGSAMLGLTTVLAAASQAVNEGLKWFEPVGPLSGKTGVAVMAWLASWVLMHLIWRKREIFNYRSIWRIALALVTLGWIGTFPPVFEAFTSH